jgi:glycerophosphoryl diester phosphodiesterase
MNTLPSFALAQQQGADGIELDVWLSKDRALVIVHDDSVDSTTDGKGRVQDKTLAELKALDAGSWFNPRFAGTRIPTLDEVFEAIGQPLIVNVEIKTLDGDPAESSGIEQAVADCITQHAMQDRVIVSSFSLATLKRFHAIAPQIALGFLYATYNALADPFIEQCQYLHPYHELLSAEYVARLPPLPLNTWTVNEEARMSELLRLDIRGLITDKPDVGRRVVDAAYP